MDMPGRWWGAVTESSVLALAAAILDPNRRQPIIVVTTAGYTTPDRIPQETLDEAEELRRAIGDIAGVAIVTTGDVSFALEAALPPKWHIFQGACRSYPANILADPDIRRSPLRRRLGGEVASEQVMSDALGHAQVSGVLDEKPHGSIATTGTVKGFLLDGEQALIDTGAVMPSVIWRDMTSPGIPLGWLIAKGATVPGDLDRDHNRFVLRKRAFGAKQFHAAFPDRAVTLALVDKVSPDQAILRVHPDLAITVHLSDVSSNPRDVLDLFFVEGEVVRVRVTHRSTGNPGLRLSDIDDDEPVLPAATVVDGGTPWLIEGRNRPLIVEPPVEDELMSAAVAGVPPAVEESPAEPAEPVPVPSRPTPGPGTRSGMAPPGENRTASTPLVDDSRSAVQRMSMTITALTVENERLRREAASAEAFRQELDLTRRTLRDTRADLGDAKVRITNFKDLHKKAVDELRKSRKGKPVSDHAAGPRDRRDRWPDHRLWLRNEILLAWVERVSPYEKALFPLPGDYLIGHGFIESLGDLDDGQFDKAMKCVVDVLTGRAKDLTSRDLHRLRTGDGGSDAPRVRPEDGAAAWRAAIEINTASARRLHYWVIGNRIELSRVGVHDDMDA